MVVVVSFTSRCASIIYSNVIKVRQLGDQPQELTSRCCENSSYNCCSSSHCASTNSPAVVAAQGPITTQGTDLSLVHSNQLFTAHKKIHSQIGTSLQSCNLCQRLNGQRGWCFLDSVSAVRHGNMKKHILLLFILNLFCGQIEDFSIPGY